MPRRGVIHQVAYGLRAVLLSGLLLVLYPAAAWAQQPQDEAEPPVRTASFALGFSAGPNLTTVDVQVDVDRRRVDGYELVLGYYLTLYGGLRVGPLHLRSGISFVNAGALYDGARFLDRDAFDVHFISVPVDVRLKIPVGKHAQPYLFAGPQVRYQYTVGTLDDGLRDDIRHLATTASLGAGVRFTLPGTTFAVSPELRYAVDITGLLDGDVTVRDEAVRIGDAFHADMLQLGVVLGL